MKRYIKSSAASGIEYLDELHIPSGEDLLYGDSSDYSPSELAESINEVIKKLNEVITAVNSLK